MSKLSFVGKTAIITGAGGALGRAYAFDLAKRGCSLLINDLGATLTGSVDSSQKQELSNAEKLVAEIKSQGGKAVFNSDTVAQGDKIVEAALKEFGRCDILINNAGNLRDKSFVKMTKEDWHSVIDVHLHGTFMLCHALWPHFQQQNFGRIVNIGSGAGLYGNFGQANYSSAKMGILGLTQTLAKEGAKNNIHVNCVVPVASSRMTETILPPEMLKMLDPSYVTPIVTFLAHDSNKGTGDCFEVGGGWYSKIRIQRSAGRSLGESAGSVTAEMIAESMTSICDFSSPAYPKTAGDAFPALMAAREKEKANKATTASSSSTEKAADSNKPTAKLVSDIGFKALNDFLKADPTRAADVAAKVRANVVFELVDDNDKPIKYWYMNLKTTEPSIREIVASDVEQIKPHAVLTCQDKTIIDLFKGSLSPEFAYMRGKLKLQGQMGAALKIKSLLELSKNLKIDV